MVMIQRKKDAAAPAAASTETATVQAAAAAPAEQPAAAAAATTAVAQAASTAVSTKVNGKPRDFLGEFKNALTVDWNTLNRIQAVQGMFVDVEDNKREFTKSMTFEVLSFQDSWQISPGTDDPADVQHVRYSNDGQLTTMGEPCGEYLAALKEAGYSDAKMGHRCTLVGTILAADDAGMVNKMVQIDLPPTSKTLYDRHRFQSSMDLGKGLKTEEQINPLKMTAKAQTKGRNTWTIVEFGYAN